MIQKACKFVVLMALASPAFATEEQFCKGFAKGYVEGWNGYWAADGRTGEIINLGSMAGLLGTVRHESPATPACKIGIGDNDDNSTLSSFEQGAKKGAQRGIKAQKDDVGSGSATDLARHAAAEANAKQQAANEKLEKEAANQRRIHQEREAQAAEILKQEQNKKQLTDLQLLTDIAEKRPLASVERSNFEKLFSRASENFRNFGGSANTKLFLEYAHEIFYASDWTFMDYVELETKGDEKIVQIFNLSQRQKLTDEELQQFKTRCAQVKADCFDAAGLPEPGLIDKFTPVKSSTSAPAISGFRIATVRSLRLSDNEPNSKNQYASYLSAVAKVTKPPSTQRLENEVATTVGGAQPAGTSSPTSAPKSAVAAPTTTEASSLTSKPSFDCGKAATSIEKMICSQPALAKADAELAAYYKKNLAVAGTYVDVEKQGQRAFIARRNLCVDSACVAEAYRARWEELAQMGDVRE